MRDKKNFFANGNFAEKVYLAIAYDKEYSDDPYFGLDASRIRMWEYGHSFEEIDNMGMDDMGKVLGYWSGKSKGEQKLASRRKKLGGG